ncbi:hypothetical protein OAN22_02570 [Alphaproteobacteria bacterium]|nr:hypothetical protein [Alphaproteobacteria bacterium]
MEVTVPIADAPHGYLYFQVTERDERGEFAPITTSMKSIYK